MKRQNEPWIGLGKYGDGTLELIKVKSQDTTFILNFKPTREDIKAMIPAKGEMDCKSSQTDPGSASKNP